MKKIIIPLLLSFLFLFGMTKVSAGTTLDTKQTSSGNISVNLNFDQGYVGGIYATIQVTGDVSFSSIEWNSALAKEYTKKYSYQNGILTIIMTTGNSAKNLLTQNKQLSVGTIHFKNNSSKSQNYRLELKKVTIVDASYKSVEMSSIHTNQNQYQIAAKPTNPTNPSKPTEPTTPTNPSKPNDSTNSGNTGNSSSSNTNNQGQLGANDSLEEDKKDESTSKDDLDNEDQKPSDNPIIDDTKNDLPGTNDEVSDIEDDESSKKGPNYVLIGFGAFALILLIGIIVSIKKAH